ncbi:MAG: hypothetical protein KAI73_01525 [Rhodospirillaceae bacterium]|nr:hypothetical protein [Rhodospirillaceae bacterium]
MDGLEWLQLANEADADFNLFEIYREMGQGRTVHGTAVEAAANGVRVDFGRMQGLEQAYRWRRRARAFDRWRVTQVSNGLKQAFQDRQCQRVEIFKQVTQHTKAAVDVLVSIMNNPQVNSAPRIRAAEKIIDMGGYAPPEALAEATLLVDAETKAKMLAALTPDQRAQLAELTEIMQTAVADPAPPGPYDPNTPTLH